MFKKLREFKWGYILLSILAFAVGVCFYAFKDTLSYLAIAIGIIVILFAAFFAVLAIADKNRQAAFFFKIAFSIAILAAGVTTLVARENAIDVIIGIIGLVLIIDGAFKLHTSAMSKRYSVFGWWFITVIAVLIIAGGYIITRFIHEVSQWVMYFMGTVLIIDAIGNFFSAFFIGSYEKRLTKEIKDEKVKELEAEPIPLDKKEIY
jgi:uncharacterized membrane protein HdeD (DUF308 family)